VYVARNEDAEARTLVIEHPARAGWTVGGTVAPVESTASWHRYRVTVEPKATVNVAVEESRPIQTQVAISTITDGQVTLLVNDRALSPALEAALRDVLARKAEIKQYVIGYRAACDAGPSHLKPRSGAGQSSRTVATVKLRSHEACFVTLKY
jgi:hypothetical protein